METGLVASCEPRQRVGCRGRDGIENAEQRMRKTLSVAGDQFGLIEGAIATGDACLRTPCAIHPFLAKRQSAGSLRVGRVVALDHPLDGMP